MNQPLHFERDQCVPSHFDHFAYGSNLSSERLRARCPSATPLAWGFVIGRQLRFHKVGMDGTAKADAFFTGDPSDRIYGVIYRCWTSERTFLDACESLGVGYEEAAVDVMIDGENEPRRTFLYQAVAEKIRSDLATTDWYAAHVIRGAAEHGFPEAYQRHLADLVARSIGPVPVISSNFRLRDA
ncbi:gamma-glutamylcyclotransferase family protein [Neorhodopirellula pilleata]|uniref:AIG2-like family protein n=1 Tax=Neorhodopirellula pilleata TaxID=2714738 RepID=A0A5C6ARV3_9BACT|nr:gamma-glutamylcyclotransferase family protein [Neorhodopirellula pilleata]TWU01702.1 hypothetical protein Pla100_14370 [Neorhodopirellula pilleata]